MASSRDGRGRAFAVGILLNATFVIAEFAAGTLADSVALIADAAHNLGDVAGLLLAWGAMVLATRAPSQRRTYGWRKSTILAALANALLLIGATGALAWEAIGRLADPPAAEGMVMIVVAAIGVAINGISALILFRSGQGHGHDHGHDHAGHSHGHDVNLRGAVLHLAADTAVSLGVVVAGVALVITGWTWLDPVTSLVIAVVIVASTWSLLRESLALALDAVPSHIQIDDVRAFLRERPGVVGVHDLHVWALGSSEVALTAHLVIEQPTAPEFLGEIEAALHERFGIDHSTLQIEPAEQAPCRHPQGC